MTGEVVHHHDVARGQEGSELLLDPGAEDLACHGPIDDQGSHQSGGAQSGQEGGGHPVAVRDCFDDPLMGRSPAVEAGHVGFHPGFVEEDESVEVDRESPGVEGVTFLDDVRPALFVRLESFF